MCVNNNVQNLFRVFFARCSNIRFIVKHQTCWQIETYKLKWKYWKHFETSKPTTYLHQCISTEISFKFAIWFFNSSNIPYQSFIFWKHQYLPNQCKTSFCCKTLWQLTFNKCPFSLLLNVCLQTNKMFKVVNRRRQPLFSNSKDVLYWISVVNQ